MTNELGKIETIIMSKTFTDITTSDKSSTVVECGSSNEVYLTVYEDEDVSPDFRKGVGSAAFTSRAQIEKLIVALMEAKEYAFPIEQSVAEQFPYYNDGATY